MLCPPAPPLLRFQIKAPDGREPWSCRNAAVKCVPQGFCREPCRTACGSSHQHTPASRSFPCHQEPRSQSPRRPQSHWCPHIPGCQRGLSPALPAADPQSQQPLSAASVLPRFLTDGCLTWERGACGCSNDKGVIQASAGIPTQFPRSSGQLPDRAHRRRQLSFGTGVTAA